MLKEKVNLEFYTPEKKFQQLRINAFFQHRKQNWLPIALTIRNVKENSSGGWIIILNGNLDLQRHESGKNGIYMSKYKIFFNFLKR